MNDFLTLTLLLIVCLVLLALVILLVILLSRSNKVPVNWLQTMLRQQLVENQKLRNQLLALGDVNTLNALNHLTLPDSEPEESEVLFPQDLASAIQDEESLAQEGFHTGELSDDLTSAGWTAPYYSGGEQGNRPVTFES